MSRNAPARFAISGLMFALVASLTAVALSPSNAGAATVCSVVAAGDTNVISWEDQGERYVLRRNGSWLASPGRNASTYTDASPEAESTYVLKAWGANGSRTEECVTDTGEVEPPLADCVAEVANGQVTLSWSDDGGKHIVRRNGKWLATPGAGTSSFVDTNPIQDGTYLIRTRTAVLTTDRVCEEAVEEPADDRKFVVHVGLDGLRADQVRSGSMPNLARLADEGASTLNARTDPALTQTLPNHTSQFTSRYVYGSKGHKITVNEDPGGTIHDAAGQYVASVFDVVHDNGGRTVVYTGKEKFNLIDRSYSAEFGAPDTTGADDGPDKIDVFEKEDPTVAVVPFVRDLIAGEGDTFGFFHIRTPDSAGHVNGWLTPGYTAAVMQSDALLQELVDALAFAGVLDQTTIIVTSDHGGPANDDSHRDHTNVENYTVPFVVWGQGVLPGADLYELNPDRDEPGVGQPERWVATPVRGHDVGNLALDLLGLPPIPGSFANADQSLRVG